MGRLDDPRRGAGNRLRHLCIRLHRPVGEAGIASSRRRSGRPQSGAGQTPKGGSDVAGEIDYATELVDDARSPLAYAIPAALFPIGLTNKTEAVEPDSCPS